MRNSIFYGAHTHTLLLFTAKGFVLFPALQTTEHTPTVAASETTSTAGVALALFSSWVVNGIPFFCDQYEGAGSYEMLITQPRLCFPLMTS